MQSVQLPIPPSANNLWRVGKARGGKSRVYPSEHYVGWLDVALPLIRSGMKKVTGYPVRVRIVLHRGKGWTKTRDGDNLIKPLLDALRKAERIVDDSVDYVTGASWELGEDRMVACVVVAVIPDQEEVA